MAIQVRYKEKKRTEKKKNLSDLWDNRSMIIEIYENRFWKEVRNMESEK